jgi:hypothetical protein
MRWIKPLSLIFLVTLLLLIVGLSFTLHQKIKQAEITNLTWSLGHLGFNSLELENISATYQQQQHIRLENVQVHWTDISTWFDSSFQITTLAIENAQLQLTFQKRIEGQVPNKETPLEFSWPKTPEEWQANSFLSERLPWLALLPKKTVIKHFSFSRHCPEGLCSLTGQLSASIETRQKTQQSMPLQANFKGLISNPISPDNQLSFQLKAALSSEKLPSLQLQLSLDNSLNLTLNNEIRLHRDLSSENQLYTSLQLSGTVPNPIWFKTLENWSGLKLTEATLLQLHQQASTPVNIDILNNMPLTSVTLLVKQLSSTNPKIKKTATTEPSPFSKPVEFVSKLSTQFEMNIELPKPTPIPAIGLLQGTLKAKFKLQQGLLQNYQLHASGNLSEHALAEKLKAFRQFKGLDIAKISFDLNSQIRSQKNDLANIPFNLSLNSVTPTMSKSQLRLVTQGELFIGDNPRLKLYDARITLQQPALKIQVTSDQPHYDIQNLALNIPFTADYQNQVFTFKSPSALIKSDVKIVDQSNGASLAIFNQSSLQLNRLNVHLSTDPINPLTWSLSSKKTVLNAQFTSPPLKAKNLQVRLTSLQLNNSDNGLSSHPVQINAHYNVSTARLEQAKLVPQFWSAKGALSGGVDDFKFSGRISNASELSIKHNSRWKNQNLSSTWSLEPLFFLGGNPLKKSFSFWPQELTLASGQMALQGQLKFNFKLLKSPLAALSGTVNADIKQVSGLYQQTAFSQISVLSALNLNNKQFNVSLPTLQITRVNHGLIAGPVQMTARYEGALAKPLQGVLEIETLRSGLFNGQAWLDPQTINLSKPFKTTLHLKDIDIEELLKQHPTSNLKGKGLIDGTLPLEIDLTTESPSFLIQQGLVTSQASGGLLQYQPEAKSGIGKSNQGMQLVLDVLDDFHYTLLQSSVSIGMDQKLNLGLTLKGQNPNVEKGRAINLNINLEEDLPSLMTSMQITNQVSETIKRRVQEKIRQQSNQKK